MVYKLLDSVSLSAGRDFQRHGFAVLRKYEFPLCRAGESRRNYGLDRKSVLTQTGLGYLLEQVLREWHIYHFNLALFINPEAFDPILAAACPFISNLHLILGLPNYEGFTPLLADWAHATSKASGHRPSVVHATEELAIGLGTILLFPRM